jgi:hypothetical protein
VLPNKWIDFCIQLEKLNLSKKDKSKIKGKRFEEEILPILSKYLPNGYRITCQNQMKGINYKCHGILGTPYLILDVVFY